MNIAEILTHLQKQYPTITLKPADTFYWSPSDKVVYYDAANDSVEAAWAILHESGHALLGHQQYFTDIELVMMEVEAWVRAKQLSDEAGIAIDEDHIEDCLDSYRDWLHKRSLCPDCDLCGIQTETGLYTCIFCHKKWHVSSDRFCRPYRRKIASSNRTKTKRLS